MQTKKLKKQLFIELLLDVFEQTTRDININIVNY